MFSFSEVESSDESNILSTLNGNNHYSEELTKRTTLGRSDAKRLHRKLKKYQIGEATDDVRLCIMCLRAIMNNQVNEIHYRDERNSIQFPVVINSKEDNTVNCVLTFLEHHRSIQHG